MSSKDNLVTAVLPQLTRFGIINKKKQMQLCQEYIQKLAVKTPSEKTIISKLSGGNQQKVVLARWLCMNPKLIILDEPTRGIDVGAKSEIEKLIQQMSDSGIAVLFISSEIEELARGCDRVAVLFNGLKTYELVGDEISYQHIVDSIAASGEQVRAKAIQDKGGDKNE